MTKFVVQKCQMISQFLQGMWSATHLLIKCKYLTIIDCFHEEIVEKQVLQMWIFVEGFLNVTQEHTK